MINSKITILNVINNIRLISASDIEFRSLFTSKAVPSNKVLDRVVVHVRDYIENRRFSYKDFISYLCVKAIHDKSFLYSLNVRHEDIKKIDHVLSNFQYDLDLKSVNTFVIEKNIQIDDIFEPDVKGGTIVLDLLLKQNYVTVQYALQNLDKLLARYDDMSSENKRIIRLLKQLSKTQNGEI